MTSEVAEPIDPAKDSEVNALAEVASPAKTEAGSEVPTFPIIGVGASAGGLEAFTGLLRGLPPGTGTAIVLVQHLAPSHASLLTEILSRATPMPVQEARDGMRVEPDHVYVIPPAADLSIGAGILRLTPRHQAQGMHRPIDQFFCSLAEAQGRMAIGVVLSGSANDGTLGLEEIRTAGGITFAQDGTAEHPSMPRSAIEAGCVDFILPPEEIGRELGQVGRHPYVAKAEEPQPASPETAESLAHIFALVRDATGSDFTHYRRETLHRRVTRRMALQKARSLDDYLRLLEKNPAEIQALYQDILINVTSFFRNPEAFEALKEKVFSSLVEGRSRHDPVRIWVLGCSTGEEAYSLAIALAEFQEEVAKPLTVQILASDVNGHGIGLARAGLYSKEIAQDVSPERLRRFFVEDDGKYRIAKPIREMCIFARHDVLTDPPFSRVDLVTCRNLLIYMEPVLQQRLIPVFHYALNPSGFLWLGNSETIGAYRELFESRDAKHRIFAKKAGVARTVVGLTLERPAKGPPKLGHSGARTREIVFPAAVDVQREADRILLAKYAPVGVLINAEDEILQFRGDTGPYLTPAPGRASLSLLKMLREGLLVAVRGALSRARREEIPIRESGLRVKSGGAYRTVDVHALPVRAPGTKEGCLLVLFEELDPSVTATPSHGKGESSTGTHGEAGETQAGELERLEQELAATREFLQSVIEQQEASNQDLQSATEEVQSANEELQSINEELETTKEEVQSSNEELSTVNDELHDRVLQLARTNNDMVNLLSGVQMAIVMLGTDLRIRWFTPMAEKLLNLLASDVGRPLSDIRLNFNIEDLESQLAEVIDTVDPKELEVQDKDGHWYSLRIRPYQTVDEEVDGALLILVDIDRLKNDQQTLLRQAELLDQTHEPILSWNLDGTIVYWNRGAEQMYGYSKQEAIGKVSYELLKSSVPYHVYKQSLERTGHWTGELEQTCRDGTTVTVETRMVLVRTSDGERLVLKTDRPITEQKLREQALRERADSLVAADSQRNEFLATLAHELRNPLASLRNASQILRFPGVGQADVEHAKGTIDRQVSNMVRMVDDLIDVSRVTRARIQLRKEVVAVATIVERAVEATRHISQERQQDLTVTVPRTPIYIEVDPTRFEQVLNNLLINAFKFTPLGGRVSLTVELEELAPVPDRSASGIARREKMVVVRVRDDGIGISPEALPTVFDLFVQADHSLERTHHGLGIGLTLAKRLVDQHGGSIEAHSAGPGQGSEFIVRLRAASVSAPTPSASLGEQTAGTNSKQRILVVDDNVDAATSLAILLRMQGHEVKIVHDGKSALEAARAFHPRIVLLDIGLPGMNGYEVARQIRAEPELAEATLVALSGYGQDVNIKEALDSGCDHHVTKPVDPAELPGMILRWAAPSD